MSAFGRQTGKDTAQWFAHRPLDQIVTSDLARATETAQLIHSTTGAPVTTDYRLRPWDIGQLSGQPITEERLRTMQQYQEQQPTAQLPGGESYHDFLNRYVPALAEYQQAGKQGNVALVTHHRNALALPYVLGGQPPSLKGPPDPGGVVTMAGQQVKVLYTPPASVTASKASTS